MLTMDNDTTSRDISRDRQTRQGRSAREVYAPYQSRSSTSQFLLPSKRRKLYHFKKKKREWEPVTIAFTAFLLLILMGCGVFSAFYYYYVTNIQPSLTSFVRPVSRDRSEPVLSQPVDTSIVTGRSWNILLLGSDNDGKFTFPQNSHPGYDGCSY